MNPNLFFFRVLHSAFFVGIFLFSSCEQKEPIPEPEGKFIPNFTLAKTSNELKAIQADVHANTIKTIDQFDDILVAGKSPIAKPSKYIQQEFRNHLVFRDKIGVIGLDYGCIEPYLTYEEFAQALAPFGLDIKQGHWGFSHNPSIIKQLSGESWFSNQFDDEEVVDEIADSNHKGVFKSV